MILLCGYVIVNVCGTIFMLLLHIANSPSTWHFQTGDRSIWRSNTLLSGCETEKCGIQSLHHPFATQSLRNCRILHSVHSHLIAVWQQVANHHAYPEARYES